MQPIYLAVIGGSDISPDTAALAREVGRQVGARGAVLLCGGLGGVMAAAAQGAQDAGGVSLGILPDGDRRRANPYLTYAIATNLGHARNVLIAHSADALIAVDGSLRHHLRGGHRPETGQTGHRPERHLGPAGAATGRHPRRSRGPGLGGAEKIGVRARGQLLVALVLCWSFTGP